jgi:putative MATE family efflux protein
MKKSNTRDMTTGTIWKELLQFALPLMVGNVFQMLYNAVDSIVVGNFVGTRALAAIGATTIIVYMAIFFFNGFSVGAGVVIANFFGAKNQKSLHTAIETTMAATFLLCIIFTAAGILLVNPLLHLMNTPANVFKPAAAYLRIYFGGITGLLIYNMESGILRAVGDTTRPLYFLILTSLLNIVLDLLFVCGFHMGIAGAAWATILSQFISAALTLLLLLFTKDIYRFTIEDIQIHPATLKKILALGLPTGFQAVITSFSNVFVQGYINHFGATVMAGWACYNKLDQFVMLPIMSMAMASTTFVSQNIGANDIKRANRGTRTVILQTLTITASIATMVWIFARYAIRLFSSDPAVIQSGTLFVRLIIYFVLFNCINHTLAGALRGRGDSIGPMVIMLLGYVACRQVYLFFITRFVANTAAIVGFGYPVGWMATCIMEVLYFHFRWNRKRL